MAHHFKRTQKIEVEYSPHTLTEYVSERTGMRVMVTDQAGPKVQGTFVLATEIFDDSGSPHTLEHLCFLGSKSYPYKGLLDKLATRMYSTTNAWTAVDHTAYTVETAGYQAFVKILPMYLEHILLPTLTDSGCYTEVFHIDGSGHDAGVVYSEMQGVQNTQSELMELRGKRIMYPEGIGFRYETGGMMEQLRVLTADRIRQFHRDMYQPKNLCLLITGEIDHDDLLSTLETFESSIMSDTPATDMPFKRPWLDSKQPPPLDKTHIEFVEFPEADESVGEISIRYFAPPIEDAIQSVAMSVLLQYLCGSSASVLENTLVEKEQVTSSVYYFLSNRPNSVVDFGLSGVEAGQLASVESRFHGLLRQIADSPFDMQYMADCIKQERRREMFEAESTGSYFASGALNIFLFFQTRNLEVLGTVKEYDEIAKWSEHQWREFMERWYVHAQRISILGKPSAKLAEEIRTKEEKRVADQIERLGPAGLQELADKLKEAKDANERPIPEGMLERYAIPSTDTIHFISTVPARSVFAKKAGTFDNHIQKIVDEEHSDLPLFVQFEHVPSNFIHIDILVSTTDVPIHLRPLIAVYLGNFFSTPMTQKGKRIEFEDVVKHLERETVGYRISNGIDAGNAQVLRLNFQVERQKYGTIIEAIRDLLWHSIFDVERIKSTTVRLLADVPEEKRSGSTMAYSVATMINETPNSLPRAGDTLVKALYLKRVKHLLKTDPNQILSQLEEIRKAICQISNFRILVTADVEKLDRPVETWRLLAEGQAKEKPLAPLESRIDQLSGAGKAPGKLSYIVPLSTIDSSFAVAVGKGPISPKDEKMPALTVAIAYLDAIEGPLWDAVRGAGLAYGTSFNWRKGNLEFSIFQSPDACKAFAASKAVIEEFLAGAREFNSLALEGAVSSVVLAIANAQAFMAQAAVSAFTADVVQGLPRDWNHIFLDQVRNVTVEQIRDALRTVNLPVFEPASTNLFVTCSNAMEQKLVSGFAAAGFKPEVRPLASFQDDYEMTLAEDEVLSSSDEELDGENQKAYSEGEAGD